MADRNPQLEGGKGERPASNSLAGSLAEVDRVVLNVIKDKKDMGIWTRDVMRETKLPDNAVNKSLELLLSQKLIKEVANIQYKGMKHYMAVEFEPSKEISGGVWYTDGIIDKVRIEHFRDGLLRIICLLKVATVDGLCDFLNTNKVTKFVFSKEDVTQILDLMVLDSEIMEVKSTGLDEYASIPVGALCYVIAQ